VGITAGSREVPGRNACDRRHTYCIIIIIIIIIIIMLLTLEKAIITLNNLKSNRNKSTTGISLYG